MKTPIWISSATQLEQQIEEWLALDYIAIDTEFERRNTYYAKPGLIQIATETATFLVDPIELSDLRPLAPVLSSESLIKVMHSMSEDVDLLTHCTGATFARVFDTQIAASLCGLGYALGYQKLVETCLEVAVDKSETRSNWLQRPLTESQIKYACLDTEYLLALYPKLKSQLENKHLFEAVFEESQQVVEQHRIAQSGEQGHLKLRGAWHLPVQQQKQLQYLVSWRDKTARDKDLPKSWIFADNILIHVLEHPPSSTKDLNRIKDVKHKSVRLYGQALLNALDEAQHFEPEHFTRIQKPIRGSDQQHTKAIKKLINRIAAENEIEPQVLCPKKLLEVLVIDILSKRALNLELISGWRQTYLSAPIEQYIRETFHD